MSNDDFSFSICSSNKVKMWEPSVTEVEEMRVYLKSKIIGQDDVIDQVSDIYLSRSFREKDDGRPFVSFFLNGKSGVGKSMLFRTIADFYEQRVKEGKERWAIPYYLISLSGYHSCEMGTIIGGLSNGWGDNSGSKLSKIEEIYLDVCERDPIYKRAFLIFDEADKVIVGTNNNAVTALEKLSEIFETACPERKRSDAPQLNLTNFSFAVTANFFTNEIISSKKVIGFSCEAPKSAEETLEQKRLDAIEANRTDPKAIIEKLSSYLTISTINRIDLILVFQDAINDDLRIKFIRDELKSLRKGMKRWHSDNNGDSIKIDSSNADVIIQEVIQKSNQHGGYRALRRYVRNFIKPRLIKELLEKYSMETEEKPGDKRSSQKEVREGIPIEFSNEIFNNPAQ